MTVTRLMFTNDELGVQPFDAVVVTRAAKYIVTELNSVMEKWADNSTRVHERIESALNPNHPKGRRDYTSIADSHFFVKFEKGNIIITNAVTDDAGQFKYLYYGNGDGLIIPKTHKFLKFYSRKNNDWVYSTFVRPISSHIIKTFQTDIKDSIIIGLDRAQNEIDYELSQKAISLVAIEEAHAFDTDQREALEAIHGKQAVEEDAESDVIPLEDQKEMMQTGSTGVLEQVRQKLFGVARWLRRI